MFPNEFRKIIYPPPSELEEIISSFKSHYIPFYYLSCLIMLDDNYNEKEEKKAKKSNITTLYSWMKTKIKNEINNEYGETGIKLWENYIKIFNEYKKDENKFNHLKTTFHSWLQKEQDNDNN